MTRELFLAELDGMLEQPKGTLQGSETLDDLEHWDSTAMISFIALVDSHNGKSLSPRDVTKCETVIDLLKLADV